jgi:hypothetical protein
MPPYLKGLHLSIEVWRPTRYSSGWAIEKEDYEDGPDPIVFHLLEEKGIDIIYWLLVYCRFRKIL